MTEKRTGSIRIIVGMIVLVLLLPGPGIGQQSLTNEELTQDLENIGYKIGSIVGPGCSASVAVLNSVVRPRAIFRVQRYLYIGNKEQEANLRLSVRIIRSSFLIGSMHRIYPRLADLVIGSPARVFFCEERNIHRHDASPFYTFRSDVFQAIDEALELHDKKLSDPEEVVRYFARDFDTDRPLNRGFAIAYLLRGRLDADRTAHILSRTTARVGPKRIPYGQMVEMRLVTLLSSQSFTTSPGHRRAAFQALIGAAALDEQMGATAAVLLARIAYNNPDELRTFLLNSPRAKILSNLATVPNQVTGDQRAALETLLMGR